MPIEDALSCPHCRGKYPQLSLATSDGRDTGPFWVECNCGFKGPSADSSDEALALWDETPQKRD